MKRFLIYILSLALLAGAFAGCAPQAGAEETGADGTGAANDGKLSVVTTIFPPYDFARAVSGGLADVTMLIDPGAEVHSFDPTAQDIVKIQECDVFIYIGGENDAWVDTVLDSTDTGHKTIVKLMDAVTPVEEETVEGMQAEEEEPAEASEAEEGPEYDEHIWTSPKNAMLMVDAIAQAMGEADSANKDAYQKNAADYNAQIKAVDERIAAIAEQSAQKLIVVADRFPFRYFVDEFGLTYSAAFSGCSAESDVSVGTLKYLIDQVRDKGIKYVYYIELSNKKVAEAVSEQTGAELLLLHSCHNVTKADFDAGATYVSLMSANADNLEKGLD